MSVKITSIAGAGDLDRERLILKASSDDDIGDYVVFRTKAAKEDKKPLGGIVPNAFWFPDRKIKKGDFVVLYTKSGVMSEKPAADGKANSHFFYWGLAQSIWAVPNYGAVLLHAAYWNMFKDDGPEE